MSRRPSDLPLLVVRVLFALTLGACFAGMTWASERSGVVRIILVDVEAATDVGMDSLIGIARMATADAEERGHTTRVLGYAADQSGALVASAALADLSSAVGEPKTTALEGLQLLRSAMDSEATLDSAEVVWIMQPAWHQWTDGVGLLREALWPGAVQITATAMASGDAEVGDVVSGGFRGAATVGLAPGTALHRALAVLGADTVQSTSGEAPGADWFIAEDPDAGALPALIAQARAGATVVLTGSLPASGDATVLPWDVNAPGSAGTPGGAILRPGRPPIPFDGGRAEGGPTPHARVLAVFEDTRPAATATTLGDGCLVYAAFSLRGDALTRTAGYVDLVDDLLHGCPFGGRDIPLDAGALTTLARPDLPERVALTDLDGGSGTPLTPILLLLGLLLVGTEVAMTRRPRA